MKTLTNLALIVLALLLIYKESQAQKYYATTVNGDVANAGSIVEYNAATGSVTKKQGFISGGLAYPYGDMVYTNYKFYGTIATGGDFGWGVIFELDPFTNVFTVKQSFNGTNGADPRGTLCAYTGNGKLYGMTYQGGANSKGVIFEYDPVANTLTKKIDLSSTTGGTPWYGGMTQFVNSLYGMLYSGGVYDKGVIFQYDPLSNIFTKKYDFGAPGNNGANPMASMTLYNSKFYGMTTQGGTFGGIIFEWDPMTNVFTKKFMMDLTTGRHPYGNLTVAGNKMYGMTYDGIDASTNMGVLFEWVPATNVYTVKHEFGGNEWHPTGSLTYDGTKLLGMTNQGGPGNAGSIFSYNPTSNVYTYISAMSPYGKEPQGALVRLPFVPEVDIRGNNVTIADGDVTPSGADYTDFGNASLAAGMVRRFTVKNTGEAALNTSNVTLTGADASSFSIVSYYTYINPGDSGYLYIRFSPTTLGTKTATITLYCDDPDENTYDFSISATAVTGDRSLVFDGNDQVSFGPNSQWNFDTGTIEFWAKPTYPTTSFRYLMANSDGNFARWAIYMNAGRDGITFWNGSATAVWNYNLTQNKWNHFAFVQSGNSMQCYINGAPMGVQTISPGGVNGRPLYIGNLNGSGFGFIGSMDEVRFWSTQRTQSQINSSMTSDVSQQAGLFAYYRFDQGVADGNNTGLNYALDYSGNCLKGTLNNFTLTGTTSNWTTGAAINVNNIGFSMAGVKGNGISIADGSTTFQTSDNTDFGSTSVNGWLAKYFIVENTGTGNLNIPTITLSGANAAEYVIDWFLPNTNVGVGGSTTFKVWCRPTSAGIKTATVNVNTNDCDHPVYDFAVQTNAFNADRGLSFDGTDDYLRRDFAASYQLTTATWEMWVKPGGLKPYDPVMISSRNGSLTSTQWTMMIGGTNNKLSFQASGVTQSWNYTFEQNQWYHVAFVSSGGTTEAFVNGVSLGTKPIGPINNTAAPFWIGQSGSTLSTQYNYFQGSLDEIRIWNIARSQAQIQANMNTDIPQQANLIGYYKFNQGTAAGNNTGTTEALDYSGNCNGMTFNNFALNGSSSNIVMGALTQTNAINFSEMDIKGNGIPIADGDNTSSATDGTDFGNASTSGIMTRIFKIYNTGSAALSITGAAMSGPDAGMFTMGSVTPGSPVPPNDSATFTIMFAPTSAGVKNAALSITNNDCNEGNYDFVISGTGVSPERGLAFDGTDDRVQRNNNGNVFEFGANATWELWMKKTFVTATGNPVLVANRNTSTTRWSCQLTSNGQALGFWNGSSFATWAYPFNQNQWYHVAFVQTGSSMETFVNGVSLGVQSITSSSQTNLPLMMGSNGSGEYFKGTLDDVRIWNVSRTPAQILANMNSDVAQQSGLVAYYRFDQGTADGSNSGLTEAQDYSGNCYSVTLSNFALNGSTSNWTGGGIASTVAINFPDANVQGNGNNIIDGSTTPSLTNHTDFGTVLTGGNLVRTYTIQNTGAQSLTINTITKTGADISLFTIGALTPAGPIAPAGSATFTVTFAPTSAGLKTANISVTNSDCDEGVYDFAIQGTGAASSFINITLIPEGYYNPSTEKLSMKDTVKAYLHSNISPYNVVDSATAVIDSNTFTGSFQFLNATSGTYYIRLKHRNTLETWSKSGGETFTLGTVMSYNFTNNQTQAYGSNMKLVDPAPTRYGIFSGETNADGTIDVSDIVNVYNDQINFLSGYVTTDLNADYFVDVSDVVIAYNNSINIVSVVRP